MRLGAHHVTDQDIRSGEQFNMFPSISRLFLRWRRGPKSLDNLDREYGRTCPLVPPLNIHTYMNIYGPVYKYASMNVYDVHVYACMHACKHTVVINDRAIILLVRNACSQKQMQSDV